MYDLNPLNSISFSEQEEELAAQQAPLAAQGHGGPSGGGGSPFNLVVLVLLRAVGVPRLHVPEQGPGRHLRDVRQEQVLNFSLWILSHKSSFISISGSQTKLPILSTKLGLKSAASEQ